MTEKKLLGTPAKQGGYKVGNKRPPVERQFGQPNGNPRHNGAWKKEATARYKLEKMLEMTEEELRAIAEDRDKPYFERRLAVCIRKGDWRTFESMINQVYGTPKQTVETMDLSPPVPLSPRKRKQKS